MLIFPENSSSKKIGHFVPNLAAKLTDRCNTRFDLMIFFFQNFAQRKETGSRKLYKFCKLRKEQYMKTMQLFLS